MKIKTAEEYINSQLPEYKEMLYNLRGIIKEQVPEAAEVISYGIVVYKLPYMLVGFGTKKGFCSFYTMDPELLSKMKNELNGWKFSGSTLYFPLGKELPVQIIHEIIRRRITDNILRADAEKLLDR